jgi:hypothetical protein
MVDTDKRFMLVEDMIERGEYFTINRARQYGKTTMLMMIWRRMSDRYLVVPLSFEGLGDSAFTSEEAFASTFSKMMSNRLLSMLRDDNLADIWRNCTAKSMDDLSSVITTFCETSTKPLVVTIDEVDKSSDNQLFLNFLGMLRNKYLDRSLSGMDSTFYSVVLA